MTGAGNVDIRVSKELKAHASGAGSIRYKGNPERVHADSNGAGSIHRDY